MRLLERAILVGLCICREFVEAGSQNVAKLLELIQVERLQDVGNLRVGEDGQCHDVGVSNVNDFGAAFAGKGGG